ncbi:MAG: TRAP transporter small permease subunit [Parasporobacterium sp.]|nr:TRAP transporter small permease subunit [Parasporobacterium sp.]
MKNSKWALTVDKIVFKIMLFVSYFAAAALFIVAILCTTDSLGGTIFSKNVPNGTDWVSYLNIPVVFLAMGFIQVERGNTVVDLLSEKFPKWLQTVLKTFGNVLGAGICGYLTYCEFNLTLNKIATHATSSSAGNAFLVWPFTLLVTLGYFFAALAFFWCIFRDLIISPDKRCGAMMNIPEEHKVPGNEIIAAVADPRKEVAK